VTHEAKDVLQFLHQVAQPLTVLQGALELALIKAETVQEYRESVGTALVQAARVIECLNQIRVIAARDSFQNLEFRKAAGHV
jgi:hypothetical protein